MKNIRTASLSAFILAALLLAGLVATAFAQQRTVTGILESVAAVGGETSGWAVKLDDPMVFDGKIYDNMEVYSEGEDLSPLVGKHVSATGTFVQWRTPERGKFIVLELCEITQSGK
jgi:hypothetical protein